MQSKVTYIFFFCERFRTSRGILSKNLKNRQFQAKLNTGIFDLQN